MRQEVNTVEEVFFHCAKAFLRSNTWDPSSWHPTAVPSVAQIAQALKRDMSLAELEKYYAETVFQQRKYE
jgi:uncharacterized protein